MLCINTNELLENQKKYAKILQNPDFLSEIRTFSKKNYIQPNPLFSQTLFELSYNPFKLLPDPLKKPLLTHLYLNTPFSLLKAHFQEALALIIEAFGGEEPLKNIGKLEASIDLLVQIIENFSKFIENQKSEELISSLVILLKKIPTKPLEFLKKTVNVLGKCHNLEFGGNTKYLAIEVLKGFLDHPKRIVRQEAANALNLWHSI